MYALLALGLGLTWLGAEFLVRGAARLALGLGVRPLVVGLTVVALGTSSPEAVVSVLAGLRGEGGIALGNVLGSNVANIGLILGIIALLQPLPVRWNRIRLDVYLLLAGSALVAAIGYVGGGSYGRPAGVFFLALTVTYVAYYICTGREPAAGGIDAEAQPRDFGRLALSSGMAAAGLLILLVGARYFLDSATDLAGHYGIPDAVVGATILAVGTSLPELAASIVAVSRGHHELGVGNIVGSNVMNLLFVLGGVATLAPAGVPVGLEARQLLLPAMLVFTALMFVFLRSGKTLNRIEGGILLASYIGFSFLAYN